MYFKGKDLEGINKQTNFVGRLEWSRLLKEREEKGYNYITE